MAAGTLAVCLALVALNALTVLSAARLLNRARREHSRREDLLLARICHLAERPFEPAPIDEWTSEPAEPEPDFLIANPEQWSF